VASIVLLPAAEIDLEDIWLSIALDKPRAADRQIQKIMIRIERLSAFAEIGTNRPDLGLSIRLLVEPPYDIPYRFDGMSKVEIIRVLHGARDLPELF
jgi:toxin ParE1/3/4